MNHSVNRSVNHPVNRSVNHSVNRSRSHSRGEWKGREWKGMEKSQKTFMAEPISNRPLLDARVRDDLDLTLEQGEAR